MVQDLEGRFDEISVDNNSPDRISKVLLPENWWSSQNSYDVFSNKNIKLVKFNQAKTRSRTGLNFPGWNIKDGDFNGNNNNDVRLLSRQDKQRIQRVSFFSFMVIVVTMIILISYGIAETIKW
jgi:hypothetical protein